MLSNRRKVLKGLTAAGASVALGAPMIGRAIAADFIYKIGSSMPVTHPFTTVMAETCRKMVEKSGGKLSISHFPASQLGADTDMLSQVRSGALEIYVSTNSFMSTLAPASAISGIAFAFPDSAKVWAAMDGALGAFISGEIRKSGLHCMPTFWENGFRQITTAKRVVKTVRDLSGQKIRVPVNPLSISLFKYLGAAPVAMNFAELYPALQTGVVDGQENPLVVVDTGKLFEVQKFCALSNHIWEGTPIITNGRAWSALPDNLKEIVTTGLAEGAKLERQAVADVNSGLQAQLEKTGMTFNTVDTASFRSKLSEAGYYKEWKAKYGDQAWAVLEESVGAPLA
jgi:tripartite ATP-independent transporter DctP family solute receptor